MPGQSRARLGEGASAGSGITATTTATLGASYFAIALIATAASSVMADSTVIWGEQVKKSEV